MYCPNPDSMLTFLVVSRGKLPSLREKRIWAPKRERVPVPVLGVAVVTWAGHLRPKYHKSLYYS